MPLQSAAAPGGAGADPGDAGQRRPGRGRHGTLDEGPLLWDKRTSIIGGLTSAFDPLADMMGFAQATKSTGPSRGRLEPEVTRGSFALYAEVARTL